MCCFCFIWFIKRWKEKKSAAQIVHCKQKHRHGKNGLGSNIFILQKFEQCQKTIWRQWKSYFKNCLKFINGNSLDSAIQSKHIEHHLIVLIVQKIERIQHIQMNMFTSRWLTHSTCLYKFRDVYFSRCFENSPQVFIALRTMATFGTMETLKSWILSTQRRIV